MKNLFLFLLLTVGLFSAQTANAQASNNTLETWTIDYYGAITVVAAGAQNVPINIGTNNCTGVNVRNSASPGCGFSFITPGTFGVPCSFATTSITFTATTGPSTFTCPAVPPVYTSPSITFN